MLPIDWESSESHLFANPRLSSAFYPSLWPDFASLTHHLWIATSGTTEAAKGTIKWVALSKQAFLSSAVAVNDHLQSTSNDIWLNALPLFHVGGLSIHARAFLSGALVKQVEFSKWSPEDFMKSLKEMKATLTSLVPAQLYDILPYDPPPHLRAVVVGGGAVSEELYHRAHHWPILPSFGMTECSSQIATAVLGSRDLVILPHVTCSTSAEGLLQIKSPALLTGYLYMGQEESWFEDPKVEGQLTTEDRVEITEGTLKFLGRQSDWIKIGGENVSFFQLESFFNKIKPHSIDAVLKPQADERLGTIIQLVTLKKYEGTVAPLIEAFNRGVMPYERIRAVRYVDAIPRSPLGKVLKHQL